MRSLLPKRWHFCCLYCYIFSALYLPQCLIALKIRRKLVNGFIKHSMTTKVLILKPSFFRLLRLQMLLLALRRVFPSTRRSTQRWSVKLKLSRVRWRLLKRKWTEVWRCYVVYLMNVVAGKLPVTLSKLKWEPSLVMLCCRLLSWLMQVQYVDIESCFPFCRKAPWS